MILLMTIQLEFPPENLKELYYHRYHHLAPLVQRRMDALWLKAHGLSHAQIAELVGVTENTLREYFELYQQGGLLKQGREQVGHIGVNAAHQSV